MHNKYGENNNNEIWSDQFMQRFQTIYLLFTVQTTNNGKAWISFYFISLVFMLFFVYLVFFIYIYCYAFNLFLFQF